MADRGQQTEQPTARRLEKARQEGRFPVSRDFVTSVEFLAFAALLMAFTPGWLDGSRRMTRYLLARAFESAVTEKALHSAAAALFTRVWLPFLVAGSGVLLAALGAHLAVTRLGFSLDRLAPGFSRLNPMARLRELPRQNLPLVLQAVLLLPVFGAAAYAVVKDNLAPYLKLPLMPLESGILDVAASFRQLLWKAALVLLVFGVIDLIRQKRKYKQDLRMSKQEVREEFKELEGNPQTRMRIRRLQRDLLRRRMMSEVLKATAVIVNPTHYAVAIRYQMGAMAAPRVVAKGRNYLAQRIRSLAIEHQVPVVENVPLAQSLYKSVEVGQEVPAHLYRAVAEILAYIYKLMNGRLPG